MLVDCSSCDDVVVFLVSESVVDVFSLVPLVELSEGYNRKYAPTPVRSRAAITDSIIIVFSGDFLLTCMALCPFYFDGEQHHHIL